MVADNTSILLYITFYSSAQLYYLLLRCFQPCHFKSNAKLERKEHFAKQNQFRIMCRHAYCHELYIY